MSDSLSPTGLSPARPLCPWDSPGKNTGVDCHFLLQGIFLTQGWNLDLLHRRQILYHLSCREVGYSVFCLRFMFALIVLFFRMCLFLAVPRSSLLAQAFSGLRAQASGCSGFSCWGAWAPGHVGFSSCGAWAYGIFLDQELNLCPLHRQVDS